MTQQELTILRHTDYCCHGCWQDLRMMPQARWRVVAVPAKVRGSDQREVHWLAMCEQCAVPESLRHQQPAPVQPQVLNTGLAGLDREEISLAVSAVGMLSGWFVAGPALAVVGLVAGAAAGYLSSGEQHA